MNDKKFKAGQEYESSDSLIKAFVEVQHEKANAIMEDDPTVSLTSVFYANVVASMSGLFLVERNNPEGFFRMVMDAVAAVTGAHIEQVYPDEGVDLGSHTVH